MTDEELTARLKELAVKLFPSANSWAVKEGVQNICRLMEEINPGEYRELHKALFARDATVKEYENLLMLNDRLERLAIRLDDEGQYTNANICWLALKELKKGA
jgi:hypothetical protein